MTLVRRLWPGLGRTLPAPVFASGLIPRPFRHYPLRAIGVDVDRAARIEAGVRIGSRKVAIGYGTFVQPGVVIENQYAWVRIGRRCDIAREALLLTTTHEVGSDGRRAGALQWAPVTIGDGVWIGARAVIMPGVTVGDGCIIAAGAVVTTDCAPDGVYAGTPARRLRDLDPPRRTAS
ncbi:acyltransferase [Knoellia sp. Soil729]|uniref:acyltransferase n=1 Tax=Knoellia sp. Soil729 TaxID=1736394 RepID=UPI0009EC5CED|nr:acyltransferase [Knoellia sp. Soil729]